MPPTARSQQWSRWMLVAALLIGASLRFYHLTSNPEGIHPDEALYGYEGWSIQTTGCDYRKTGCPPLYLKGYSSNWDNRTSVLYPYMYSILWRFLPMTTFFLRLPSVLFGLGVIFLIYLLGRQVFPSRPVIAGTAALLGAISPIAISWSRIGHDPITMPFFCLLIAVSIFATPRRPWCWLVAGLALAVGMYSYQPFKVLGPSVALATTWFLRPRWSPAQRRWLSITLVVAVVIVLPFLANQLINWPIVQRQFHLLSVFHETSYGWWKTLYNIDQFGQALLTLIAISLPFVPVAAGLGAVALWRSSRRVFVYFLIWMAAAMIPVVITVWGFGSNEMQSRSLGLAGPFELLAAAGLVALVERWRRWLPRPGQWLAFSLLAVLFVTQALTSLAINHVRGGWCCYMLGGMDQVAQIVQRPEYADRPVIVSYKYFMQGVNLLWNMKIPPVVAQSSSTKWEQVIDGTGHTEDLPVAFDRFRICTIADCYRPRDDALYVVPAEMLPHLPVVTTFTLHYFRELQPWKIVDNAATVR